MSRLGWAFAQATLIVTVVLSAPVAAGTATPHAPGLWNPHAQLDNSRVH